MTWFLQLIGAASGIDLKGMLGETELTALAWHMWNTATSAGGFFRAVTILGLVSFLGLVALLLYAHWKNDGWLKDFSLKSRLGMVLVIAVLIVPATATVGGLTAATVQEVIDLNRQAPAKGAMTAGEVLRKERAMEQQQQGGSVPVVRIPRGRP